MLNMFDRSNLTLPSHSNNVMNYEEVELIGRGAYGTVYKARDLSNPGQLVALKKVRIPLTDQGVNTNVLREVGVLKQLQHSYCPNVVQLLDVCHGKQTDGRSMNLFLVFEHVDQDLAQYLADCPPPGLGPDIIKRISYQLLQGVDFLHSHRIVHRDLKPQNVLITNSGLVKLADFGLARIYSEQALTSVVVTLWYRAPEVLLLSNYASSVDIWSCACILFELYARKPLFPGNSESDQLRRIFEVIGSPEEQHWPQEVSLPWSAFSKFKSTPIESLVSEICPEAVDLIQEMLHFPILKRISAADALKHEYFKEYEQFPPTFDDHRITNSSANNITSSTSTIVATNLSNSASGYTSNNAIESNTNPSSSPNSVRSDSDSPSAELHLKHRTSNSTAGSSGVSSLESSSPTFDCLNVDLSNHSNRRPNERISTTDNDSCLPTSVSSLLGNRNGSSTARQLSPSLFQNHLESPSGLLSLAAHETMPPSCSPYSPFQNRRLTAASTALQEFQK